MITIKKGLAILLVTVLSVTLLSACTSDRAYQGAGLGGAVGAIAGALIDRNNAWRGAVIGGALGATLGGGVTEISTRASREAAQEGKPVAYQSADGFQRVEAHPLGKGSRPNCRMVREQIYQDGKLVRDEMREVCH